MRSTSTIGAACVAAALAGCATTEPAAVLAGGPRMIEIYRGTAVEPAPEARGAPEAAAARDLGHALDLAAARTAAGDSILVCGSLYLIGQALALSEG